MVTANRIYIHIHTTYSLFSVTEKRTASNIPKPCTQSGGRDCPQKHCRTLNKTCNCWNILRDQQGSSSVDISKRSKCLSLHSSPSTCQVHGAVHNRRRYSERRHSSAGLFKILFTIPPPPCHLTPEHEIQRKRNVSELPTRNKEGDGPCLLRHESFYVVDRMGERNECQFWCVCCKSAETQQPRIASWTTHDDTPDCRRTLLQNFLRLCWCVQSGYVRVRFPSMRPTKDCLYWTKVPANDKVTAEANMKLRQTTDDLNQL